LLKIGRCRLANIRASICTSRIGTELLASELKTLATPDRHAGVTSPAAMLGVIVGLVILGAAALREAWLGGCSKVQFVISTRRQRCYSDCPAWVSSGLGPKPVTRAPSGARFHALTPASRALCALARGALSSLRPRAAALFLCSLFYRHRRHSRLVVAKSSNSVMQGRPSKRF
jgi:hypothetical protein